MYTDDATSEIMVLCFGPSESAFEYFAATRTYLVDHGKPVAFHNDKASILRVAPSPRKRTTGVTQFARAPHNPHAAHRPARADPLRNRGHRRAQALRGCGQGDPLCRRPEHPQVIPIYLRQRVSNPKRFFTKIAIAGQSRAEQHRSMTNHTAHEATLRSLPLNVTSTWVAALASMLFFGIGLRALLSPEGASAGYGVSINSGEGLAFVRAFGARNVGLSLVALALIVLDMRAGLAAVFFASAVIAVCDLIIVAGQAGAPAAAQHLVAVVALGAFGCWFAARR